MIRFFPLCILLFMVNSATAQQAGCRARLDSACSVLAATSSFKAQITGDKKTAYDELLTALRRQADTSTTNFGCFCIVARLFDPISDNHLNFFERKTPVLAPADYADKKKVMAYRSLPVFRGWPVWSGNLRALEKQMQAAPADSVEGVYHFLDQLTIAVVRTAKKDSLVGVVLRSAIPFWQKGELVLVLREYAPLHFRALAAQPFARSWGMTKNEKFIEGMLTETPLAGLNGPSRWMKDPSAPDFRNLAAGTPEMELRWLDTSTQYLHLGNFRANEPGLTKATEFYDSIAGKLVATRLVLDLRNNGGGAFKNSRRVLNQLEKYSRQKKIYVLVNNGTMSNAEQFLVLLKFSPNVIILGEPTNGMVTYGSNQGGLVTLPGDSWVIYPSDTREAGKLLQYEDLGLQPDVRLANDRDWLVQVLEHIRKTGQ